MTSSADIQRLDAGEIVHLYTLDATAQGGHLLRYTPATAGAPQPFQAVAFGGHNYLPLPIDMTGVERAFEGPTARPTLSISAVNPMTAFVILGTDNLRGARVTRVRTLSRFLDGSPEADANRKVSEEIWRVEQMTSRSKDAVVWQLASPLDFDSKKLPGRQVLRDICAWRYRRWDPAANAGAGAFDYSKALCPYAGANYFDANDNAVQSAAADKCSRRLSGCRKRYPAPSELPFGGFPGVSQLRA